MIENKYEYSKKLENEIITLGISESFKENPAFSTNCILDNIRNDIIYNPKSENIIVSKNDNEIVINYDIHNGNGFAQILRNPNDESVFYIRTRLDRNTNENLKEINYNLKKVKIYNTGNIEVEEKNSNFAIIKGVETSYVVSESNEIYDHYGIELERRYQLYQNAMLDKKSTELLNQSYNESFKVMNAYISNSPDNQINFSSTMTRKGIDIAQVRFFKKEEGMLNEVYNTELLLNSQNGLQTMSINSAVVGKTAYIPALSKEELEEKINNTRNSKVREGLIRINNEVIDRTKVAYDPELDNNLKIEENNQNKTK